ncbi:hypothetical protein I8752_20620 [Nostocaceae cyanobacterium CENA369]|uniref:Uncharacterized protein n=1 Tax=Dendronalium phyllosphericum CENA369 TaxID=1725256 RepID=A0A8J7IDS0_9NOST|nr:hypothetical protein [Dendronalium phyllosphericum]MBH8575372.1 hypothetical protein [Dendronalium phyllosphericum CENA369]
MRYLPPINCNKVLLESKSRIFEFQQDEKENNLIRRQTKLFDITSLPCECQLDPDTINPLTLPLQPLNFATEVNQFDNACIYFILDKALPLILYRTHLTSFTILKYSYRKSRIQQSCRTLAA